MKRSATDVPLDALVRLCLCQYLNMIIRHSVQRIAGMATYLPSVLFVLTFTPCGLPVNPILNSSHQMISEHLGKLVIAPAICSVVRYPLANVLSHLGHLTAVVDSVIYLSLIIRPNAANQERPLGRLAGFACSTLLDSYV